MPGDLLAIWIKPFGSMELMESRVNTGIPRGPTDNHGKYHRGEAEISCIFCTSRSVPNGSRDQYAGQSGHLNSDEDLI